MIQNEILIRYNLRFSSLECMHRRWLKEKNTYIVLNRILDIPDKQNVYNEVNMISLLNELRVSTERVWAALVWINKAYWQQEEENTLNDKY